jgi:hypothetical protein
MVGVKSSVVVIARRVMWPARPRRAIPQPILVGSARHRVAIQRRTACEHDRANFAPTI